MDMSRLLCCMVLICFMSIGLKAQQLEWQFAPKDTITGNCTSMTSCKQDQVCYFLKYTPSYTGTVTSYTLGFVSNCTGATDPVFNAASCIITDNSNIVDACGFVGSFLLQVSGTGSLNVDAGVPVLLHEVCFDLGDGEVLTMVEDEVTQLTVSVDSVGSTPMNPNVEVDRLNYLTTSLDNERCICFTRAQDSGDPNPTIQCLDDLLDIKYDLKNCNSAMVNGLPSGVTGSLITNQFVIDGIPDEAGNFPYIISSNTCDCKDATGMIQVDSSAIVINNNCYETMENALFDFQPGQSIIIRDDVTTEVNQLVLDGMTNPGLKIIIRQFVIWTIKPENN